MDDTNDLVEQDAKKAKRAYRQYQQGDWKPTAGKLLEQVFFLFSITGIVFMVVALPFVGDGKAIPGTLWLGTGLGSILLFGALGMGVRILRHSFDDIDSQMGRKLERR